jgi:hypothetical protein
MLVQLTAVRTADDDVHGVDCACASNRQARCRVVLKPWHSCCLHRSGMQVQPQKKAVISGMVAPCGTVTPKVSPFARRMRQRR